MAQRARDLQLLIKPVSGDCNQACAYCFYRRVAGVYPESDVHRMSDDVLETLVRRYLKLRLAQSVFCWQGGEPTLAGLEFYRRAVHFMQAHGASGQSVSNAFQTNGLLLDDAWCAFFAQYRFLVGVSLDGPPDLHNAYRRTLGGGDTYDAVIAAMRCLARHGVEHNILSVVTSRSVSHGRRIYAHLRELGVRYMQFIPCLEAAEGGAAEFSVTPEAYGEFLCEVFDLWRADQSDGVSVRLFDALIARELTGRSGSCDLDGDCAGYLVVEHNGDAYPCDFFVRPEMRLGNIRTTALETLLTRAPGRELRRARHCIPDACRACPWETLCRGGCLKDRERLTGRRDVPTHLCAAFRRFFAHAARPIREIAAALRASAPIS